MGRRFLRYIERHFHLCQEMAALSDGRVSPKIPIQSIVLTAFLIFASRFRSLNAIEGEFHNKKKHWPKVISRHLPSADRLGDVMDEHVKPEELRQMLNRHVKRAQRMKALHRAKGFRFVVGSADGHELFATRHRRCEGCLMRLVEVNGEKVIEYYHRVVVLEVISANPSVVLDLEPVMPGEDEVAAAERVVRRVLKAYPRVFQVIVGDAAYQEAPFFRTMRALGKYTVAVLKDEGRALYQDAAGMLPHREPVKVIVEEKRHRGKLIRQVTIRLWDFPDLETWPQLGGVARVVHCQVETLQRTKRGTQWVMETTVSEWWWATDLTVEQASAEEIMRMGRRRWVEENTFNELAKHWAMDHRFKHEPNAIVTFLLVLFMAHFLVHLFYARALQPEARANLTCLALSELLRDDLGEGKAGPEWRPP